MKFNKPKKMCPVFKWEKCNFTVARSGHGMAGMTERLINEYYKFGYAVIIFVRDKNG